MQSSLQSDVTKVKKPYSIEKVVQQMQLKKERKVPFSVYKDHSEEVILILSSHMN
jgi:hypothetical protein